MHAHPKNEYKTVIDVIILYNNRENDIMSLIMLHSRL
jgi:hypothetical protein